MVSAGRFRQGGFKRAPGRSVPSPQLPPSSGLNAGSVLDQYQRAEWAQGQTDALLGGLEQESIVPYWLEPVGNTGFYVEPAEEVQPWDCDRWPNSPYCGGSAADPFDLLQLLPFSINATFATNSELSEFCVTTNVNLFAVPLPSGTYCYRAPWARPLTGVPRPPSANGEWTPAHYPNLPGGLECTYEYEFGAVLRRPVDLEFQQRHPWIRFTGGAMYAWMSTRPGIPIGTYIERLNPRDPTTDVFIVVYQTTSRYSGKSDFTIHDSLKSGNILPWHLTTGWPFLTGNIRLLGCPAGRITPYQFPTATVPPYTPNEPDEPDMPCCPETNELLRLIAKRLGTQNYPVTVPTTLTEATEATEQKQSLTELLDWTIKQFYGLMGEFPIEISANEKIPTIAEGILKLFESRELLKKRLGTADYPVTVPKSLIDSSDETEEQESLTQFLAWTARQLDALLGQFPIKIKIEDVDSTQEGNQEREIAIPNLAEGIAELYGLTVRSAVNTDIHTDFLMRLAAEVIAAKNAALIAQDYAKANASYLGYKGNTVKRKIDYAFDPTKLDKLDGILSTSNKELIGWQDDDKNTVQSYLEKLMFAAAIIKQVHFRPNADKDSLLKQIANILGITLGGINDTAEDSNEDKWIEFLRAINNENGGFNKNSPFAPEVIDPNVRGETETGTNFTGFSNLPQQLPSNTEESNS